MHQIYVLAVCLGIAAAGCQPVEEPVEVPQAERAVPVSAVGNSATALGSASCDGSGCHGRAVPAGKPSAIARLADLTDGEAWRSSASHWHLRDPHVGSYRTLSDLKSAKGTLSADIMKKLYPSDRYPNRNRDASKEAACLACHSNPTLAGKPEAYPELIKEGVSCEACHGNASIYRTAHLAWDNTTDREGAYRKAGMNLLYKQGDRARNCMKCHVGAPAEPEKGIPARDVNHDLIAAGHPRLNFEYTSYLRALPPHWAEKDRAHGCKISPPDELEAWAVGQKQMVQAAKDLTAHRERLSPMTEFAEFKCFACHKLIGNAGGLVARADPLPKYEMFAFGRDPIQRLKELPKNYLDWDEAQHRYFGLVAQHLSQKDNPNEKEVRKGLEQLGRQLQLPRGDAILNSLRDYDSEMARKTIIRIVELMTGTPE